MCLAFPAYFLFTTCFSFFCLRRLIRRSRFVRFPNEMSSVFPFLPPDPSSRIRWQWGTWVDHPAPRPPAMPHRYIDGRGVSSGYVIRIGHLLLWLYASGDDGGRSMHESNENTMFCRSGTDRPDHKVWPTEDFCLFSPHFHSKSESLLKIYAKFVYSALYRIGFKSQTCW